jgi:2'-5' RNA ligase
MVQPGSLILVHMLDPQGLGTYFDRTRWPLHITLMPWFEVMQPQQSVLRRELGLLAQATPPINVVVGDTALFGPNQEVPVNLITDQLVLMRLHTALLDLVHLLQLPIENERWVGAAYKAHISQTIDRRVDPGDKIIVDDFYTVRLIDNHICQITEHFQLKGSDA